MPEPKNIRLTKKHSEEARKLLSFLDTGVPVDTDPGTVKALRERFKYTFAKTYGIKEVQWHRFLSNVAFKAEYLF